jgi:uncharacterized membrane protein AbrB (regulator of aidB expression)
MTFKLHTTTLVPMLLACYVRTQGHLFCTCALPALVTRRGSVWVGAVLGSGFEFEVNEEFNIVVRSSSLLFIVQFSFYYLNSIFYVVAHG